jgi:hypothetical protein
MPAVAIVLSRRSSGLAIPAAGREISDVSGSSTSAATATTSSPSSWASITSG